MGDAVEDVLYHDCLHADLHHVEEGKQRPPETGVNPVLSIVIACQKLWAVNFHPTRYLNHHNHQRHYLLKHNENVHLSHKKFFRSVHWHKIRVSLILSSSCFFPFQPIVVWVQVMVVAHIYQKQSRLEIHSYRVKLCCPTVRSKLFSKRHNETTNVQWIHSINVLSHCIPQVVTFWGF